MSLLGPGVIHQHKTLNWDSYFAATNRVLTREPGVGQQVELCARYIVILFIQARLRSDNTDMIKAVFQLVTMVSK